MREQFSLHSLIDVGVEGIAVAAAVVLLVVIVMPAIYRQRTVAAEAPKDERYASDLRMIRERTYTQTSNSEYRCTLFPMERVMDRKQKPAVASHRQGQTSQLRALARARSRAKARLAARHAGRVRYGVVGVAVAAVTTIAWILVFSVKLPVAIAGVLSAMLVLYAVGYGYVINLWRQADRDDVDRLAAVQSKIDELRRGKGAELSGHRRSGRTYGEQLVPDTAVHPVTVGHSVTAAQKSRSIDRSDSRSNEEVRSDDEARKAARMGEAQAADAQAVGEERTSTGMRVIHETNPRRTAEQMRGGAASAGKSTVAEGIAKTMMGNAAEKALPSAASVQRAVTPSAARVSAPAPAKITLPSYTLKPRYDVQGTEFHSAQLRSDGADRGEATTVSAVSVPYRPHDIGERIGDVPPEEPHAVPDAIADAPERRQRSNVLGVGETLDSLLDRRRA